MIKVGVLGASGYAGADLVRLLVQRQDIELIFVDSGSREGIPFSQLYPNMKDLIELDFSSLDVENNKYFQQIDVLFCALPHAVSQKAVVAAMEAGLKVIDLSADFRLQDVESYESWYQTPHIAQDILKEAVYGLPEINRPAIKGSQLIANPGCYPTSILLGLYPLLKAGYQANSPIISDSKSSLSGAGRSLKDGNLFSQANENVTPYSVGNHRHTPEILEQMEAITGQKAKLLFSPHLVPMNRGLLSTIYVANDFNLSQKQVQGLYEETYQKEYFVRVLAQGTTPNTKAVAGSNYCDISVKVDDSTGYIVIMAAIDNLIKGAAGQAMQNMNILFGLNEEKGLEQFPTWP